MAPVLQWFVAVSAAPTAPPVAVDDRVYVALRSGAVAAHSMSNGEPLWSVELPTGQPLAVDDTHVFVASGGAVHALQGSSGQISWRAPAGAITAPLLVHAGWVIVAAGAALHAFRAADGHQVWRQELGTTDQRPFIDGDVLYASLTDGRIVAVDLPSGKSLWERRLPAPPGEPLVIANRLYVGSGDKHFNCLRAENGAIAWRRRVGAEVRGRPAADDERVYFVALDNEIRAVDRRDGALEWHHGVPFRPSGSPIVLGTAVAVPGPVTELRVFEAATGVALKAIRFAEPVVTAPFIVPGGELSAMRIAAVTGGLNNEWRLTLFGPAGEVPEGPPLLPLTVLPGVVLQPGS